MSFLTTSTDLQSSTLCVTTLCPFGNPVANISLVTNSLPQPQPSEATAQSPPVRYNTSRTFRKRHKVSLAQPQHSLIRRKPSFGIKDVGVNEDVFVVVHKVAAQGYSDAGWDSDPSYRDQLGEGTEGPRGRGRGAVVASSQ
jgi:hypothetical protein